MPVLALDTGRTLVGKPTIAEPVFDRRGAEGGSREVGLSSGLWAASRGEVREELRLLPLDDRDDRDEVDVLTERGSGGGRDTTLGGTSGKSASLTSVGFAQTLEEFLLQREFIPGIEGMRPAGNGRGE